MRGSHRYSVCACVCVHVHTGWSRVAEVGLYFRDKASKSYGWLPRYRHLLSGSERLLRHQWINSYSYASIHHPPLFSSGRSPPHPPHSRSLWIIWGFEHNPAKSPSRRFATYIKKRNYPLPFCFKLNVNVSICQLQWEHFHCLLNKKFKKLTFCHGDIATLIYYHSISMSPYG